MEIGARRTENGDESAEEENGEQRIEHGEQRTENREQRAEKRTQSTVNRIVPGFFGEMLRFVNFMKDIDVIC